MSRAEIYNNRLTLAQLPFYGVCTDDTFTNCCTSERYLNKLTSPYELDAFNINIGSDADINWDQKCDE